MLFSLLLADFKIKMGKFSVLCYTGDLTVRKPSGFINQESLMKWWILQRFSVLGSVCLTKLCNILPILLIKTIFCSFVYFFLFRRGYMGGGEINKTWCCFVLLFYNHNGNVFCWAKTLPWQFCETDLIVLNCIPPLWDQFWLIFPCITEQPSMVWKGPQIHSDKLFFSIYPWTKSLAHLKGGTKHEALPRIQNSHF